MILCSQYALIFHLVQLGIELCEMCKFDCFVMSPNIRLFFKNGPTQAPGPSNRSNNVVSECIALGSADATFSVWLSHKSKPLIRGKRFSSGGITDLAWSRDGFTLLCCSLDGKVFGVNFEEYEIGENVSDEVWYMLQFWSICISLVTVLWHISLKVFLKQIKFSS